MLTSLSRRTSGRATVAFYFRITTYYRNLGRKMASEPLGTSYEVTCGEEEDALPHLMRSSTNGIIGKQVSREDRPTAIDWLFRQYKTEKAYTEKISPRSSPDDARIMQVIVTPQIERTADWRTADHGNYATSR